MLDTAKPNMSTSQFKDFACGCELAAYKKHVTREYKEPDKKVFIIGRFIHAYFEGKPSFEAFIDKHHDELHTKKGDLYADFQLAQNNARQAEKIKSFMALFQGTPEVEYRVEMFGVEWLIRVDNINLEKKFFTDLKYVKSLGYDWMNLYCSQLGRESRRRNSEHTLERRKCVPFYEASNYWVQMAIYQKVLSIATGEKFLPMIGAISKETPPDIGIFAFDNEDRIKKELAFIESSMPRITALKNGEVEPEPCGMCEVCREHNIITGKVPMMKAESHFMTLKKED